MKKVYFPKEIERLYRDKWSAWKNNIDPDCVNPAFYPLNPTLKFIKKGDRILDIGCGPGRVLRYLISEGFDSVGLEYDIQILKRIKRDVAHAKLVQGDIRFLPFKFDCFDKIIVLSVIDHLHKQAERNNAWTRIGACLRRGGLALSCVGYQNSLGYLIDQKIVMNNQIRRIFGKNPVNKVCGGIVYLPEEVVREVENNTKMKVIWKNFLGSRMVLHGYFPFLRKKENSQKKQMDESYYQFNRLGELIYKLLSAIKFFNARLFCVIQKI